MVFYVLKFIFPSLLIQAITSPTLLRLGEFFNLWIGFPIILNYLTTLLTLYLFTCASIGQFVKNKHNFAVIISGTILISLFYYLIPSLYTHACSSIMLLVAFLCKGKFLYCIVSFAIHGFLSQFLFAIRGFETIITRIESIGVVSALVLGLEGCLWLIILATLFYFKEKNNYGNDTPPLPEQKSEDA